jgi:WhiB family redox-sensing transcriptional regulator
MSTLLGQPFLTIALVLLQIVSLPSRTAPEYSRRCFTHSTQTPLDTPPHPIRPSSVLRGVPMPQVEQLPGRNADVWDWQLRGACRGVDSSVFFPPDGERGRARAQREQNAKKWCRSCPVLEQCRTHALAVGEPYGIWGGMSEAERHAALRCNLRPSG